ncbi:MAG TPA: MFS transporter, partial [Planctomycetota bacterium]|nr:MFS transporter [Planctomycetota bacterium]
MRLFVASIISLVATAFGFISRAFLLNTLGKEFNLTQEQIGSLSGAGLFPFALSIIFFSLIVDRIGYGRCMVFAWLGHTISGIIMLTASSFPMLYIGTLLFALANGTVEAVINPVTATMFPRNKTHYLNILHAGWPGGLVLGGLLFMLLQGSVSWKVLMGLYLVPTAVYGVMMIGQKFPVQERVAAGVTYDDMLKE